MSIVYFHSSAFVKLLVEEAGSDIAATMWDGCDAAVCSRICYPEVRAALAAAGRDNRLDVEAREQAERAWEEYWAATRPIQLTEPVTTHAGELAGQHALRAADAIHLASALAIGPDQLLFAAWDKRLRAAVETAGIQLGPMEVP